MLKIFFDQYYHHTLILIIKITLKKYLEMIFKSRSEIKFFGITRILFKFQRELLFSTEFFLWASNFFSLGFALKIPPPSHHCFTDEGPSTENPMWANNLFFT